MRSEFCDRLLITSRKPLKSGWTLSADALRLIIRIAEEWKYRQRAITVLATDKVIKRGRWTLQYAVSIMLPGFMICRNKSEPTCTQWFKGIGKVVICKALHKGNVN